MQMILNKTGGNKMTKIRYFIHCPRGFQNERILMASDDENIIKAMHKALDDGMAGKFEEVDENEAKKMFYRNQVDADIETAVHNSDREFVPYPKWEDLQHFLTLNSKLEYGSL